MCVEFTPTIPHCSMATLIGLSIRVKLLRSLPTRFKVRPQNIIMPISSISICHLGDLMDLIN